MYRSEKVADAIRCELSSILLFEVQDARLSGMTLTRVMMTKDLSVARVYFEKEGTSGDKDEVLEVLKEMKSLLRRHLAHKVKLKFIPDLEFFYDETGDLVKRIEHLMEGVK